MGTLSTAKTLGGVGSILMVLGIVPLAGPVLGIIGFILALVAVKYISDAVADKSIFNNMILAVVIGIAGIVGGAVFAVGGIMTMMAGDFFPGMLPTGIMPTNIFSIDEYR